VRAVVPATAPAGAYRVRVCIGSACRQSRRAVTVAARRLPAPAPPPPAPIPAPVPADTTPPTAPTLSVSSLESAVMTGSTLHYRAGSNGSFTVTAHADPDVARVDFASLGSGWFGGGGDPAPPFTAEYGFSLFSAPPASPIVAVAFDAAGNASAPAQLNGAGDGAGPTVSVICEPDDCTGEVSLSAADSGSGVARVLYSLDGSEPTTPFETKFLAPIEMPLRVRAVDRVGNVGPELARTIGPPPTQFTFAFGDGVNAAGDDSAQTAWIRPGVAGSLRVSAPDVEPTWPDLGAGWTVEPDLDRAVYSFTAAAAPPLIVAVNAGASRSFFRLRHDGTPPAAPAIACACDQPSTVGVEISLSASDADSGVGEIRYSLDGSEPTRPYAGPFKAYASGTLRAVAFDRVGNAGPIAARTLNIDVSGDPTAPTTTLRLTALEGTQVAEDTITFTPAAHQSFAVEAVAEDPESGIAAIAYPDIPGWNRTPTQTGVVYDRAPSAEASGPHAVRATNHAGRATEASFRIVSGGRP
jgi:hypothetical protein